VVDVIRSGFTTESQRTQRATEWGRGFDGVHDEAPSAFGKPNLRDTPWPSVSSVTLVVIRRETPSVV